MKERHLSAVGNAVVLGEKRACNVPGRIELLAAGIGTIPTKSPTSKIKALNNRIEILYCTQCRWLLRAAWMAQELLTTFDQEIAELTLKPGIGGIFEVRVNGSLVWSRKDQGRFPEITELKQLVRDRIAPERNLGHSDK
jgi:selenoprotein W-related protein